MSLYLTSYLSKIDRRSKN